MKITYERLNQIIEEEVVKFKSLNEQVQVTGVDDLRKQIRTLIDQVTDLPALQSALTTLKNKATTSIVSTKV